MKSRVFNQHLSGVEISNEPTCPGFPQIDCLTIVLVIAQHGPGTHDIIIIHGN